jgi:hypothetical protein
MPDGPKKEEQDQAMEARLKFESGGSGGPSGVGYYRS